MRNLPDEAPGSELTSEEYNNFKREIVNLVESANITLDGPTGPDSSLEHLSNSIAAYSLAANFYTDIGGENVYTLSRGSSPFKDIISYEDGMIAWFKVATTNTGASTCSINTLPVKALVTATGIPLPANTLLVNDYVAVLYRAASDRFELMFVPPTSSGVGTPVSTTVGVGLTLPIHVSVTALSHHWAIDVVAGGLSKSLNVSAETINNWFSVHSILGDTIPVTFSVSDNGTNTTLSLQNNHTIGVDITARLVI